MTITVTAEYRPGSLVTARGREWVVLPSGGDPDLLRLRPLGGACYPHRTTAGACAAAPGDIPAA